MDFLSYQVGLSIVHVYRTVSYSFSLFHNCRRRRRQENQKETNDYVYPLVVKKEVFQKSFPNPVALQQ